MLRVCISHIKTAGGNLPETLPSLTPKNLSWCTSHERRNNNNPTGAGRRPVDNLAREDQTRPHASYTPALIIGRLVGRNVALVLRSERWSRCRRITRKRGGSLEPIDAAEVVLSYECSYERRASPFSAQLSAPDESQSGLNTARSRKLGEHSRSRNHSGRSALPSWP
jgi:hypothetical protein